MNSHGPESGNPPGAELPKSASPPVIPNYELLRRIGGGSYGEVWLGRNVMGSYHAIKVVYRKTFQHERPFEREFDGIRRFEPISRSHVSQMAILHVGRTADYFYYVMELADDAGPDAGCSILDTGLTQGTSATSQPTAKKHPESGIKFPATYSPKTLKSELTKHGRLPFSECLEIGLALTTALEHLHHSGLVHRDIKPSNIIFVNGSPKLADIGLVTDTDATVSFVGTEGFLPPEGPGSRQADIYSLGKVLYEISTGKDRQNYPEPPTRLGEFGDREQLLELDEVIHKACENDSGRRYQSAEEMHADLLLLKTGRSVRHLRAVERRLALATRIGAVAAALTFIALGAWFFQKREANRAARHSGEVEQLLARAVGAEKVALEKLRGSYLDQARANRWSGRAGQRFESLAALSNAAALGPSPEVRRELRNEAIACMILPDLALAREWPGYPEGSQWLEIDGAMQRYARGDTEGNISVRRIADDQELFRAPSPGEQNWALRLSPDGRFLAAKNHHVSNRQPNFFQVWDVDGKKGILSVTNIASNFVFDFSPDNRTVVAALWRGPFVTYDLSTGQEQQRTATNGEPNWMRFRPDGAQIALADSRQPRVDIRDTRTGDVAATLPHPKSVWCLDWHPTGKFLATGCTDNQIYVWDLARTQHVAVLKGHTAVPVYTSFSHGGDLLASRCWNDTTRLWEPFAGRQLANLNQAAGALRFSTDDSQLGLITTGPHKLGVWHVAAGRECRALRGHTTRRLWSASFSADGRLLATRSDDGVRLWDLAAYLEVAFLPVGGGAVRLHPDGQSLLTSGGHAGVHRWPIRRADTQDGLTVEIGPRETLSDLPLEGIALSPDGQRLAAGRFGDGVRIFNLRDPATKPLFLKHRNGVNVSFSPDGKWIVTSVWQGHGAKIWDAQTGELARELTDEANTVALFSPDGRWLVTANRKEYRFLDASSWQAHHSVPTDNGDAGNKMAFRPDGKVVAITHRTHGVRLLECETGRELATLAETDQSPFCFSPDGTILVTGDVSSELVRLWDLRSIRQQLATMKLDWE